MISLISFEEALLIPREEVKLLELQYTEPVRIGWYSDKLQELSDSYKYQEDCLEKDGTYYKDQVSMDVDNPVESYWLATKYTGDVDYVSVKRDGHLVNLISFAPKCTHKFFITDSVTSAESSIENIELIFQRLEEKSAMLEKVVDKVKENTFNNKTNVHVGGGLVTTYNDLLLKEDVCTDILQQELNNGWRIIAICVQADQRRPDYILGRYNPTLEVVDKPDAGR